MMNKKYLMRGFAALALVAGFSSCVKDVEGTSQKEIDDRSKENAEMQLGITIPDGQTWDMASKVEANVTVNGDYGASYVVSIYENNPFINNTAVVLGKAETVSGGTANTNFTCPDATKTVFVAIKDEKGYSYVKPAAVVDGKVETTFGGEQAAGARTMRAARSSAADDFVIPTRTQPDFSAYINDATAISAENNTTNPSNTVRHYIIPAGTTWNDNIPLISASDPDDNSIVSVYVLGTLNVNAEQRINGGYGGAYKLIVGNGGVVNIASGVTLRSNANQGSGYVGEIHIMAGGTIQGDGKLEFSNGTNSYNYNGGTIDVGTINNNGGTLYNAGILEADIMEGGAGLSIYENAGKVHIGRCVKGSSTANTRIHNNCWWECDGDIYCRNIQQGSGAYIKGANLGMTVSADGTSDISYIWAKGNSLIDIPGYVAFNNVDIVGPTGDGYAYLQFGEVTGSNRSDLGEAYHDKLGISTNYSFVDWNNGPMTTAISNNIRLSLDTYDLDWNIYQPSPCGYLLDMLNGTRAYTAARNQYVSEWAQVGNGNAVLVAKGQVNDVKTESECSPGIDIVPPTPIYEELKVYTYAFEDQTVGTDYDMNDVVLKVSYKVKSTNSDGEVEYDKTKLTATLVAAGATYNIKIKIGNTYLFNEQEIHDALGVNRGVMVNTGNGKAQTATPISCDVAVPTGFEGDFTQLPVSIEVLSTGKTYVYPNTDNYPHAVMIPVDWRWPLERIIVTEAYPGTSDAETVTIDGVDYPVNSFDAWAATPAGDRTPAMKGWYNYPNTGKTMVNN